jgi:hypothetical protein
MRTVNDAELPLHPTIIRWLRAYSMAADDERDTIVAAMLTEWNAVLARGTEFPLHRGRARTSARSHHR